MVPSFWVKYDEEDNCLKCQCYDSVTLKNKQIFNNAVRNLQPPPTSWNFHQVEIRGYANTYASDLERLDKLQIKRFAFTTDDDNDDDDDNDGEKQQIIEKHYRLKGSKTSGKQVEKLLSECEEHFAKKPSNEVTSNDSSARSIKPKNKEKVSEIIAAINLMQTTVLDRINELSHQIGTVQSEVLKLKAQLQQLQSSTPIHHLQASPVGIYTLEGYDIPFKNCDDFEKFDEDLKHNTKLRQKCMSIMYPCLDTTEKPMESILKIAKKFFKKDVLEFYTAIKERKGKKVLKTTSFYSCLYNVIISEFAKTTSNKVNEKQFQKDIGRLINNCKDWDSGRKDRNLQENLQQNKEATQNQPTTSNDATTEQTSLSSQSFEEE